MILLLLFALACAGRAPTPTPALPTSADPEAEDATPTVVPAFVAARVELSGLAGLACDGDRCQVLVDGALHALDPVTLALGDAPAPAPTPATAPAASALLHCGQTVLLTSCEAGPCLYTPSGTPLPELSAPSTDAGDLGARWNAAIAAGWRSPFASQVPAPSGGRLIWTSRPGPRVMRTGGGIRVLDLDGPAPRVDYRRALALHPTGQEAYVVQWQAGELLAFDPVGLRERWRIPLRSAAHGLFIEPAGRLLLLEESGDGDPERDLDFGLAPLPVGDGGDPSCDLALALAERPHATTTAVVDLSVPRLVWREDGRYLSSVSLPDGALLLATTHALVRLETLADGASAP